MKKLRTYMILLLLLCGLLMPATAGAVIYVKWDAGGANNGSSWADAYTDLQDALTAAGSGDTVWVAGGTYTPTTTTDRYATFTLVDNTFIYGGFDGTESSLSRRDITANETILSGEIGAPGIADNSYHVVTTDGISTCVLDGFTVTLGNSINWGGGIEDGGGNVTYANLIICDNHAHFGGGMRNVGAPTLQNVTFINNFASSSGGGLYIVGSGHPILIECTFEENSTEGEGGAILYDGGGITMTDCYFLNNTADIHGGGMMVYEDVVISGAIFEGNHATGGSGGGIHVFACDPTIENVVLKDNVADVGGGGIYIDLNSTLTLYNAVLQGNQAGTGGGVSVSSGSHKIANAVFYGNSATHGGGIEMNLGVLYITNATFHDNSASNTGGGLRNRTGAMEIANTIFWENSAGFSGDEIFNQSAGNTGIAHSLIRNSGGSGTGWDAGLGIDDGNNIDDDPLYVDGANGNLRLTYGSQAVNAGDNSAPFIQPTDLDGNPRILDSIVDMGAYEFDPITTVDVSPPSFDRVIQRIYPNPFNPLLTIVLDSEQECELDLAVYDVRGRLVRALLQNTKVKGRSSMQWDGRDTMGRPAASGIYFIVMRSADRVEVRKAALVK
jgi:parallel beta-helix repeat protein